MSALALVLLLIAAVMHATWNLLVKRALGGALFVWLFNVVGACIYAPVVLVVMLAQRPHLGAIALVFLAGSAVAHLGYFLMLQRGYRAGDLSLVYPLARGTGPLLTTAAAIAVFGERPAPIALLGTLSIAAGIILLTVGRRVSGGAQARGGVAYGLLIGLIIAAYTLWDKHAVGTLSIPPLLLDWVDIAGQAAMLLPYAGAHRTQVAAEWRLHRHEVIGVAVLCPLAYILVLSAMVFTPVSYVAPAREISILAGAFMGAHFLAEGQTRRRLVAAGAMVMGVVALAVG